MLRKRFPDSSRGDFVELIEITMTAVSAATHRHFTAAAAAETAAVGVDHGGRGRQVSPEFGVRGR